MNQKWLVLCFLLFLQYLSFSLSLCLPQEAHSLHQFNNSFTINPMYSSDSCDDIYQPKTTTWKLGTDCCSWLGITCHPISGHVIYLDLSCSGLHGKIHPNSTLFHLSHLQSLNLAFNNFSQSQLSSHFGAFPTLTHLNLSYSNIQGEIPSQISHLSKLVSLDLSGNYYPKLKWKDSTWKKLLQNATALRELVLDSTDMSSISISSLNLSSTLVTLSLLETRLRGSMTNHILCSPNLQYLDLLGNYEYLGEGELPELSCSGASLRVLGPSGCGFKGSIPPSFSNLTHLTSLYLSDNNLNGSIPPSLLTLPQLTFLYLKDNNLNGQIPNVFHHSNKFQKIDLSHNNIGVLSSLSVLDLQMNKLYGTLPNSFSKNNMLSTLNLNDNQLEGPLPESLSNCTYLQLLNLGNNQIEDTFPRWFQELPYLKVLVLRSNKLHGPIPNLRSKHQFPSLIIFDISSNNLNGPIPKAFINSFKAMKNVTQVEGDGSLRYMEEPSGYMCALQERYVKSGLLDTYTRQIHL
ncbi:hypothetical protein RJT34_10816 [Clitoria ternatea]|uniref:Leucine-rich repeat-containing N-terminal plant-type domain-containing protein n=1 Tax=Clitoria ternatea TaxID=43366 RepID=A0AAN9JIR6_CLITE